MGCGASTSKLAGIETPLNHVMKRTGISSIDEIFIPLGSIIKDLENFRATVVDGQDPLLELSGAAAYKEPTLARIFYCLLQKLSTDFLGDFSKMGIKISLDKPYVTLAEKGSLSTTISHVSDYIEKLMGLHETVESLVTKITEMAGDIADKTAGFVEEVQAAASGDPFGAIRSVAKVTKNAAKSAIALKRVVEISVFTGKQVVDLKNVIALLADAKKLEEFSSLGKKAKEKKLVDALAIAWEFAPPADRLGKNHHDCLKILKDKLAQKKKVFAEIKKEEAEGDDTVGVSVTVKNPEAKHEEKHEEGHEHHEAKHEQHQEHQEQHEQVEVEAGDD